MNSDLTAIRPFDNGSQFADWTGCNCDRCSKGSSAVCTPEEMPTCEIEYALSNACMTDGNVTSEIARRMGYTEHKGKYVWPCGEVVWTEEWMAEYLRRREKS